MEPRALKKGTKIEISVPYERMSADEVRYLQKRIRETEHWIHEEWGTFGPNGDRPLEVRYLPNLDTDHLEAILITQPHLSPKQRATILELLKSRYEIQGTAG